MVDSLTRQVVCCVGSSLNPDNMITFARADMSIGISVNRSLQVSRFGTVHLSFVPFCARIPRQVCVGRPTCPLTNVPCQLQCTLPNKRLPAQEADQSAEQFATLLTSLSCSFLLHRDADIRCACQWELVG